MLYVHTQPTIEAAEKAADAGESTEAILSILRNLSLDEFGELLISLPRDDFPALSAALPHMASEKVQMDWTGGSGITLLRLTTAFARQAENNYTRYTGRALRQATIMDFGCGYGRILRMMYYFSNPSRIWGVDAWQRSLALCQGNRMPGNFVLSEKVPDGLPVGDTRFDFAFAFSVFTHLAPSAAAACLRSIRRHMSQNGLFVATIRPVEYWPFHDQTRGTNISKKMAEEHLRTGYAYLPHNGPEGETYGDATIDLSYFDNLDGWDFLGHDWSLVDPYQISVILRPA